jgi:hypothetical protein
MGQESSTPSKPLMENFKKQMADIKQFFDPHKTPKPPRFEVCHEHLDQLENGDYSLDEPQD